MAQRVKGNLLVDPGFGASVMEEAVELSWRHGVDGVLSGKEPTAGQHAVLGLAFAIPAAQDLQQSR